MGDRDGLWEAVLWIVVLAEAVAAILLRFDGWLMVVSGGVLVGSIILLRERFWGVSSKAWDRWIALLLPPVLALLAVLWWEVEPGQTAAAVFGMAIPLATRYSMKLSTGAYCAAPPLA